MRTKFLGPHTFPSSDPHQRHPGWLRHFTPRERRQLIDEDQHARTQAFGVLIGAMLFGMTCLLFTLFAAWWFNLL